MAAHPHSPNWFGRNWKWFVPVGCLGLLVLFALVVGLFVTGVFGLMRQAEPYRHALAAAQADDRVVGALGRPIEAGFAIQGNISVHNDEGSARLNFPISGPKGDGRVYVVAEKTRGQWRYEVIEADIGADARVDLRLEGQAP